MKNLLWQVLELHPDVDAIIEAIVWDNARPEDPWSDPAIRWTSQDMHQVDVTPMENALDDLCQTLRLNTSYTLFLMNPKLPYPDFNYGYRFGLSNAELDRLHEFFGNGEPVLWGEDWATGVQDFAKRHRLTGFSVTNELHDDTDLPNGHLDTSMVRREIRLAT